jgi:hypothetical protein
MDCRYNGIKRFGESCTLNNNCKYPNCKTEIDMGPGMKIKIFLRLPGTSPQAYYSKDHGLTTKDEEARPFVNEHQATMFKEKYLMKTLPSLEPYECLIIPN